MLKNERHIIICTPENQLVAENIAATIQSAGKKANLMVRNAEETRNPISGTSISTGTSIILLISNDFLRSYGCMNSILQAAQTWKGERRLIPVITNSVEQVQDGQVATVETKFERVNDIIQYMNFWQDKYLDLRKERRIDGPSKELEEKIEITKNIAAEIGDFLRLIRKVDFMPSEEFVSQIEQAYDIGSSDEDLPEGAAILPSKDNAGLHSSADISENELVEMIKKSSEQLLAELKIENRPKVKSDQQKADELSMEILKSIPGLDQLAKKAVEEFANKSEAETRQTTKESGSSGDSHGNFSKKEMEKIDDENEELLSILNEVLRDAGFETEEDQEEYQFEGDDPDNPAEFDLDTLYEEDDDPIELQGDENLESEEDEEEPVDLNEDEILLNLIDHDGDGFAESEDCQEILEEAINLFREGQIEEGILCFANALEDFPQDTTIRYYYAYSLAKFGNDYEAAKAQLEQLLKLENKHPDAWFLLAELAENQQDFDGARKCFQKTISCDPDFAKAHYRLGLLLIDHFQNEELDAAHHLTTSLKIDPENADAEYMLASLMNEFLGEPEKSVRHFNRTLALHPEHPFANYDLALVYHQLGDKQRASAFYKRAIEINPELQTPQNDEAFGLSNKAPNITIEDLPNPSYHAEPELENISQEEPIGQAEVETSKTENQSLKTVLITGGTAGIGKATAEIFAKNGYRVIITGRRKERLEEISASLVKSYKADIHSITFDVRDLNSVKSAIDQLPEEWQDIDILINNAGLSKGLDPIHEGKIEDWDAMIDTNVKGLLYMTRAISPKMVERKSGHIINVSSIAGTEVYPGGNVYCASKAAVSSLTRAMRLDLYQHNIRVSQVAPGHVEETEFARVRFDWDTEKAGKVYENFQPLKSSDIAETIYFIATRPPHVNIQDIYIYSTQQACATMIDRSGR